MAAPLCPPPSFDIFTLDFCPWPYAHILAPFSVYMHLRNVWATLFIVLFFEVFEVHLTAAIGTSGDAAMKKADPCESFSETISDSLIGDWWMGVAGTWLAFLLVWATDGERFVSIRRWWVMLLEMLVEILPNMFYGIRFGGMFWMVAIRPAVVALVELLGWRYWHDKGSIKTISAWITIEVLFATLYFLDFPGTFYNRAFIAIGATLLFIAGCYAVLIDKNHRRHPRRAILGLAFLHEEEKEKIKSI